MKIINTKVGPIHTNCYVVYDEVTKDAVVIDPGEKATYLLDVLKENSLNLKYIFLTHGHFDHVIGVAEIQETTGATPVVCKKELKILDEADINKRYGKYMRRPYKSFSNPDFATDGSKYTFGGLTAEFIHTPGHTKGSMVIKIEDSLFTGDTLFAGECGRCDLEGGDFSEMLMSLKKLSEIEKNYKVYPGHEQTTTLLEEKTTNRYMLQAQGL